MSEKPPETQDTEEKQEEFKGENPLEQLIYLALGTVMVAKERMENESAQFRAFQHQAQDNARALIRGLSSRGEEGQDTVRSAARDALRDLLREVVDDLGLATKKDLEQLRKDLER